MSSRTGIVMVSDSLTNTVYLSLPTGASFEVVDRILSVLAEQHRFYLCCNCKARVLLVRTSRKEKQLENNKVGSNEEMDATG